MLTLLKSQNSCEHICSERPEVIRIKGTSHCRFTVAKGMFGYLTFLAYFREVENRGDGFRRIGGPKRYYSDYRSLSEKD